MQQQNTIRSTYTNGHTAPDQRGAAGFSLVEVLVAIVLLTVGIFALIQLFPPGFLTLQIAANETAASHLGEAALEQLGANNINQLQDISALYVNTDGSVYSYDPIDNPDAHLQDTSLNNNSVINTEDIDAERAVQGETVRIPPAVSLLPGGTGSTPISLSIYTPNFAPIYMPSTFVGNTIDTTTGSASSGTSNTTGNLTNDNFIMKVSGLPWVRVAGDSNVVDPDSRPQNGNQQYLVDYSRMKLGLGPQVVPAPTNAYPEPFNFSVQDSTGKTFTTQFIWDPANTTYVATVNGYTQAQWFGLASSSWKDANGNPLMQGPATWQPGTEKLWRDFHIVYNPYTDPSHDDLPKYLQTNTETFTAAFGYDPYSYALAYPALNATGLNPTNMGVLAFSPLAAQIKDANGKPLMASITYEAADWHIIHEDNTLGTSSQPVVANANNQKLDVRLTLRNLYQIGQPMSDNTIYSGIDAANVLDVVVLDLNTGQTLIGGINQTDYLTGAIDYNNPFIDYNNGVLAFNQSLSGRHVRIFYKAQGDWGLALIKAAAVYTQATYGGPSDILIYDNGTPAPASGTSVPQAGTYEIDPGTTILYFPGTDIGKIVRISGVTGSDGKFYSDAHIRTIQPDSSAPYEVVMNGRNVVEHLRGKVDLTYDPVDSLSPDGDKGVLPVANPPTIPNTVTISTTATTPIQSVTGESVTARVIWKDRSTWKFRDISTVNGVSQ